VTASFYILLHRGSISIRRYCTQLLKSEKISAGTLLYTNRKCLE